MNLPDPLHQYDVCQSSTPDSLQALARIGMASRRPRVATTTDRTSTRSRRIGDNGVNREKAAVRDFWEDASCGESLYLAGDKTEDYSRQANRRYELEPYIADFAGFEQAVGKRVLEVGVGLGADHQRFANCGAALTGIDLTERAISHTRHRFAHFRLESALLVADAEQLPFATECFDLVYSWGVIHHSPNPQEAASEMHRVLRAGGEARVMIYHKWSLVGAMLWARYGLLRGRPWASLRWIYARHLESPGTKAYTRSEGRALFAKFSAVHVETILTHGDLLTSSVGQRHRGIALTIAKAIWPRSLLRHLLPRAGLFMLIRAIK
jgi:SAM-dependent methyltransferase